MRLKNVRGLNKVTTVQKAASILAVSLLGGLLTAGCGVINEGTQGILLTESGTVGRVTFPDGSTSTGGDGTAPVDGLLCDDGKHDPYHIHVHLSLFVNGDQIAIPEGVGIPHFMHEDPNGNIADNGDCYYYLHTHDKTGIIHDEAPAANQYTLGNFFDIWGEPLTTSNMAGFQGPVTAYVDGTLYTGDPRAITFAPYKEITLEVGSPLVTPPKYVFPVGY